MDSLDSMEGVPEWPRPAVPPAVAAPGVPRLARGHALLSALGAAMPGAILALGLAVLAGISARVIGTSILGFARSPISDISLAVLLGLILRNSVGVPAVYEPGVRLCARSVLRFGIILLGLRLGLAEAGALGIVALPVIVACIVTALLFVAWLTRALGLPARLGSLIAVGTSICGVSAIAATAPVIDAEEDEVAYAVACITLFGLLALFVYPFVAHGLFGDLPRRAGIFLGTAIHDTSQVAGAAMIYQQQYQSPETLAAATVTKLLRNLCMIAVIPLIGTRHRASRLAGAASAAHTPFRRQRFLEMVPLFVLGFIAMVAVRTAGDYGGGRAFGLIDRDLWHQTLQAGEALAGWCLAVAMAAIGLGTGLARIRRLGARSLLVGLGAALVVGAVSASLLLLFSREG